MNVFEASKSGRRFKRKSWNTEILWCGDNQRLPVVLRHSDILAEDWEIEDVEIKTSEIALQYAIKEVWDKHSLMLWESSNPAQILFTKISELLKLQDSPTKYPRP